MKVRKCDLEDISEFAFRLCWKPDVTPSIRRWTSDARQTGGEVLGILNLYLPIVACVGTLTFGSISDLLQNKTKSSLLPRLSIVANVYNSVVYKINFENGIGFFCEIYASGLLMYMN